jgi:hypothetical protein
MRMKLSNQIYLVIVATLAASASHLWAADAPATASLPDLGENAALVYWQAFALMPKWDAKEQAIVGEWKTASLDNATDKMLQKASQALELLHTATGMPNCDWGLRLDAGPAVLMPHLSQARAMARVGLLSFRYNWQLGKKSKALDNLLDVAALARQTARGPLISLLVASAIDKEFVDGACEHLGEMNASELTQLRKGLAMSSLVPETKEVLRFERAIGVGWLANKLAAANVANVRKTLTEAGMTSLAGETPKGIKEVLDEAAALLDETGAMLTMPYDTYVRQRAALVKKMDESTNPFIKLLFPAWSKSRDHLDALGAKLALLDAAAVYIADGKEAFAKVKDPYGDGPFTVTTQKDDTGSYLVFGSQLKTNGQATALRVKAPITRKDQ